MTNTSEWHNTGSNGRAREVWVRTVGGDTAEVLVMPFRCLVNLYAKGRKCVDGDPYDGLSDALLAGERWLGITDTF